MLDNQSIASFILGTAFVGGIIALAHEQEKFKKEHFSAGATMRPTTRPGPLMQTGKPRPQQGQQGPRQVQGGSVLPTMYPPGSNPGRNQYPPYPTPNTIYGGSGVSSNVPYAGPPGALPQKLTNAGLTASGDQLLDYQLYQQAVNAATPTVQQLNSISGNADQQTGITADKLKGGLSANFAPYDVVTDNGPNLYASEYQAVNIGNDRAQSISACAQNLPTFVSSSLLPKPTIPGANSWNTGAPQDILANQNFLSASQQIGVDTVLSSNKNPSYDIRNTIPNPINVVSPWNNTSITPDLDRRPLDGFLPDTGLYSCGGPAGCGQNGYYVGK